MLIIVGALQKRKKKKKRNLGIHNECKRRGVWVFADRRWMIEMYPSFIPHLLFKQPRLLGGHQSTLMKWSLKMQRPLLQAEHYEMFWIADLCGNVPGSWRLVIVLCFFFYRWSSPVFLSSSLWNVCLWLQNKGICAFMCDAHKREGWAYLLLKNGAFTLRATLL